MATTSRRTLLSMAGLGLAGVALGGGLAGCSSGTASAPTSSGPVTLRFTWWGNDKRTQLTNSVIEKFHAAHPDITIQAEPGDWSAYWDKLATQMAANDAPDIIQMDEKYISEYANRGALLDLGGVDVSAFAPGTVDSGVFDGTVYGVNSGVNAPIIVANPKVFDDAGVEIPDDATWTWDDYHATAQAISAAGAGQYWGSMAFLSVDAMLKAWVRQLGKQQWTADGLGFGPAEVESFWTAMLAMQADGSTPGASETAEDEGQTIDQSFVATGRVGLGFLWSNQITAMDKASGQDLRLLRLPSPTGRPKDAGAWYKASMYWSANGRTRNPDAVRTFIDFLANSPEAGTILGTERGFPPNTEVLAALTDSFTPSDKKVVAYLETISGELGKPSLVPPPGGGQSPAIQLRHAQNVMFGRGTVQAEAQAFVDEVTAGLT